MALIDPGDKFIHYYYEVKEFYILYENDYVKLPNERVVSLFIINNYIENLFPIVKIVINIDKSTYYKILKNKSTVKFKIRMQKFYRNTTNANNISLYKDYISKTFSLILDDDDNDFDEEVRKLAYKNEEKDLFATKNEVEFFLFDSHLMKEMKKTINMIGENCSVTNAISYINSITGVNDLLMSPADNQTIYDQLIIPPMKLSNALAYLDTFYGIHQTGSIIYYGLDRSYLTKYEGQCSAFYVNEKKTTTIIVPKAMSKFDNMLCCFQKIKQPDTVFNICDYKTISFRNEVVTKDLLEGKDVRIVNLYNGEIEDTLLDDKEGRQRIILNRGENKYFKSIYNNQIKSCETVINATFENVDLDSLTPNKRYNFIFEDTKLSRKYKGNYILVESNVIFIRQGNEFKANINCTFRKG